MIFSVFIQLKIIVHTNVRENKLFEFYIKMWYYVVDTTLIGGTKSGSEDSSFNTLLMCVSFFLSKTM